MQDGKYWWRVGNLRFQICVRDFLPGMDRAWTKHNIDKHESKTRLAVDIISMALFCGSYINTGERCEQSVFNTP